MARINGHPVSDDSFKLLSKRMAAGEDQVEVELSKIARGVFDEALKKPLSFEGALAEIYLCGMQFVFNQRRRKKPKPKAAAPSQQAA